MKKICIVCGKVFNNWFMRLIGFLLRDKYDFKTCSSCRGLYAMGANIGEIRAMRRMEEAPK